MTELRCIVSSVSVGLPGVYSSSLELSPPPATTTSAHTHTHTVHIIQGGGTHSTYHTGWGVHTVRVIQGGGYTRYISYRVGGTQYISYRVGGTHSMRHTGWGVHYSPPSLPGDQP